MIQLGRGTKPGDPLGDIIFLFAMRSALQRIRDDHRNRGRVWSVPVYPLEPPMPLTSRCRDELGKPRFVDLSDVSYMDDATLRLVCDTAEQLASEAADAAGHCGTRVRHEVVLPGFFVRKD